MGIENRGQYTFRLMLSLLLLTLFTVGGGPLSAAAGQDLEQILSQGRLRHLGVPYARFVTGSGDGLDVELVQHFARHLGVTYEFVPTTWETGFGDLTGKDMRSGESVPVKGDIVANGLTILEWRKEIVAFSIPTFPSQVWLIARADHPLTPILPGRDLESDIEAVNELVSGQEVMGVAHTCLDPRLYEMDKTGALIQYFSGRLNELAPAVINKTGGLALLDVPDALVAMEKWPGQIKVIGPVSAHQQMAVAMNKGAVDLKKAFNLFFESFQSQGRYQSLVEKYYPVFPRIYPDFFSSRDPGQSDSGTTQ